jgi:hypothetical protein
VVLICIPLRVSIVEHFFITNGPFVCLLLRNICLEKGRERRITHGPRWNWAKCEINTNLKKKDWG